MLSRFERFSFTISSIYGYIQKIEREEMEKYGLKGAYAQYLVAMQRFPQGITAARLGEVCDKDKAAVSRVVTEMEDRELIERECTNENAYRATLRLTKKGQEAAAYVCEKAKVAVGIAGAGLTEESREHFYKALELIASNLQSICREGIPEK